MANNTRIKMDKSEGEKYEDRDNGVTVFCHRSGMVPAVIIASAMVQLFYPLSAFAGNPNLKNKAEENAVAGNLSVAEGHFGVKALSSPPSVMLVLGKDIGMFEPAYLNTSDIDGDGITEIMFDPSVDYEGLFDNRLCYKYNPSNAPLTNKSSAVPGETSGFWYPSVKSSVKRGRLPGWSQEKNAGVCPGYGEWSGNFLNYLTATPMDILRKALYGGIRTSDAIGNSRRISAGEVRYHEGGNSYPLISHGAVAVGYPAKARVLGNFMLGRDFTVSDFTGLSGTLKNDESYLFAVTEDNGNHALYAPAVLRYGLVRGVAMPNVSSENIRFTYPDEWLGLPSFVLKKNDTEKSSGSENRLKTPSKIIDGKLTDEKLFTNPQESRTMSLSVVACSGSFHDERYCKNYGSVNKPVWQPAGLLQKYGESSVLPVKFGLMTGSYVNNLSGGGLRAGTAGIEREIYGSSAGSEHGSQILPGSFNYHAVDCSGSGNCGIIPTINNLNLYAVNSSISAKRRGYGQTVRDNDRYLFTDCHGSDPNIIESMFSENNGGTRHCGSWGNPLGEILHASMRYFQQRPLASGNFFEDVLMIGEADNELNDSLSQSEKLSSAVSLVISTQDISFDDDRQAYAEDRGALQKEFDYINSRIKKDHYRNAGELPVEGIFGITDDSQDIYNNIPSPKKASDLRLIKGVSPETAYQYGSYNVAAVASLFGRTPRAGVKDGTLYDRSISTYVLSLDDKKNQVAINFPAGNGRFITVNILPVAQTVVAGSRDHSVAGHDRVMPAGVVNLDILRQNGRGGTFRVTFTDSPYGVNTDNYSVVEYDYQIIVSSGRNAYVRITMKNVYEHGDAVLHAGYVITGVENKGTFFDLSTVGNGSNSHYPGNIHAVDNIISDIQMINCLSGSSFSSIKSVVASNNSCMEPKGSGDKLRQNSLFAADMIDGYYQNYIIPSAEFYYGNRAAIISLTGNGQLNNPIDRNMLPGNGSYSGKYGIYESGRIFRVRPESVTFSDDFYSPLRLAARFGIGSHDDTVFNDAAEDIIPENYYRVKNPGDIYTGLDTLLRHITAAGVNIDLNRHVLSTDYELQAEYIPGYWQGDLIKKVLSDSGKSWHAADTFARISPDERLVMTMDYDANRLRRVYAADISLNSSGYSYMNASYKEGALANLGESTVRRIMAGASAVSENDVTNKSLHDDGDKAFTEEELIYVDKLIRWILGEHQYEDDRTEQNITGFTLNESKLFRKRISMLPLNNVNRPEESVENERFVLGDITGDSMVSYRDYSGRGFIAFGANDGMLHIIDEENGCPVVSYIPSVMQSSLAELTRQNYGRNHRAFVENAPKVYKDVAAGKIYLYGTYGSGFKGGYLLNVTELGNIKHLSATDRFRALNENSENPLLVWEIRGKDDSSATGDSLYIGKQVNLPSIMFIGSSKKNPDEGIPYLVYGSGPESAKKGLVIVDMLYKSSFAGDKCPVLRDRFRPCIVNQIATPVRDPWGFNRDNALTGIVTYSEGLIPEESRYTPAMNYKALYFGDLFGYLWKLDLLKDGNSLLKPEDWSSPKTVFQAKDINGVAQPITAMPALGFHPHGGIGIVFGTGSLLTEMDRIAVSRVYNDSQSVYMLRDDSDTDPSVNVSSDTEPQMMRCDEENDDTEGGNTENAEESRNGRGRCLASFEQVYENGEISLQRIDDRPKNIENGWFFDLASVDHKNELSYSTGARVVTQVLIADKKQMVLNVNIPDTGGNYESAGGSSYIMQGDWVMTGKALVKPLRTVAHLNALTGEGEFRLNSRKKVEFYYGLEGIRGSQSSFTVKGEME